ncbi:hypothetical protein K440DRAFT_637753 [Wilcoxina mikolae CBS 423.85]|nr:hypothetical protein K440DRAFT_637753 [Wilcoxina mikolae CBS 423.85]
MVDTPRHSSCRFLYRKGIKADIKGVNDKVHILGKDIKEVKDGFEEMTVSLGKKRSHRWRLKIANLKVLYRGRCVGHSAPHGTRMIGKNISYSHREAVRRLLCPKDICHITDFKASGCHRHSVSKRKASQLGPRPKHRARYSKLDDTVEKLETKVEKVDLKTQQLKMQLQALEMKQNLGGKE